MGKNGQARAKITFAVEPRATEADGAMAFSGVAYSGGVVEQWGRRIVVDLSAIDGEIDIPVLTDHDNRIDAIAGRGTVSAADAEDGGRQLRIDGLLTDATEAGRKVSMMLADGFPMRMSIGFRAKIREADGPVEVNGRKVDADVVMEEPTIHEVSFVAVPADPATRAQQVLMCADLEREATSEDPEVARLSEALAQAEARAEAAERALAEARESWRKAEIDRLFADIDRDPPEDVSAYLEMSDAAFAAWADDIRALSARPVDPALTVPVAPRLAQSHSGTATPSERLMQVIETISRAAEIN